MTIQIPVSDAKRIGLETINDMESGVRSYVRAWPTVFSTASGAWLTDTLLVVSI